MSLHTWLAFVVASWLIALSPGPGAISCMAAGLRYGYRRAAWNIVGLEFGVVLLVLIVAAGLGAILATSAIAFDIVKWLGAGYLMWLGVQQWRARPEPMADAQAPDSSRRLLLARGFLVNASNPKGILFMLAVLPQFIDPAAPQWRQYAICAATLVVTDVIVMSGYTLLASRVLRALRDGRHARAINRLFGGLFVGAGILLASFRRT
ncbi:MAG: homoserine/homoserine lactone efflux protein [Rhodocyclaceae bacterium]